MLVLHEKEHRRRSALMVEIGQRLQLGFIKQQERKEWKFWRSIYKVCTVRELIWEECTSKPALINHTRTNGMVNQGLSSTLWSSQMSEMSSSKKLKCRRFSNHLSVLRNISRYVTTWNEGLWRFLSQTDTNNSHVSPYEDPWFVTHSHHSHLMNIHDITKDYYTTLW